MPHRSADSSADVPAFPLSKTELDRIRWEAKEEFLSKLYLRLGPVIEKLLQKVTDSELQLSPRDVKEIAKEYSVALTIGAAHFAKILEEAVRSRQGPMDEWARQKIEGLVDQFLAKMTTERASHAFFEKLEDRFTFVNREASENAFAAELLGVRASGALKTRSRAALDRAALIHGTRAGSRAKQYNELRSEAFSCSEDYRSVTIRGTTHTLTSRQAHIIQILDESRRNGHPDVGKDYLLEKLETPNSRVRDSFKSDPSAWKALIRIGTKKGTYRLNV
jgi:hypothetical protein